MADQSGKIGLDPKDRVPFVEPGTPAKESRVYVGAPDYRVFIYGVEISHDVFSVQVHHTIDDGISTATVNIVNDNLKWTFPTALSVLGFEKELPVNLKEFLFGQFGFGTNTQDDKFLKFPLEFLVGKRQNALDALTRVDKSKLGPALKKLLESFQNNNNYPFLPGEPLIQMSDPIRIFLKNPWNLVSRTDNDPIPIVSGEPGEETTEEFIVDPRNIDEEWYFAFTGFVSAVTEDFDAQSDRSILRLYCEDIRRQLRYARTSTTTNVFGINLAEEDLFDASGDPNVISQKLLSDINLIRGVVSIQSGMKLVSVDKSNPNGLVDYMLFGDTQNQLKGVQLPTQRGQQPVVTGFMGFKPEEKRILLIDGTGAGVEGQMTPFLEEMYPILNTAQVDAFGADWTLGAEDSVIEGIQSRTGIFVDHNKLFVIMPNRALFAQGGVSSQGDSFSFVAPYDWGMRFGYVSEFRSRFDVINDFVKKLDCIWYATPKGDIVVEFPQYDFEPQRYDRPWRNILSIQDEFSRFSLTEDDRNIKTLTVAVGSSIPYFNSSAGLPFLAYKKKLNLELVARYGIREQIDNRPFMYSEETINSSLSALAAMWQELANADAYRLEGLDALPNFRAHPGRPFHFKYRNVVGFATEIHHMVIWNELAQTTYGLRYIRHFDPVTGTWRKLSGAYGWVWGRKEESELIKQLTADDIFGSGPKRVDIVNDPTMPEIEGFRNQLDEIQRRVDNNIPVGITPAEIDRAEQILTDLESSNDVEFRKQKISEFTDIMKRAI